MKRIIFGVLALVFCLSLSACGKKPAEPVTPETVPQLTEAPYEEPPMLTEAPEEATTEDPDDMEGVYTISAEEAAAEEAEAAARAETQEALSVPETQPEEALPEETLTLDDSSPVTYKGTAAEVAYTLKVNVRRSPSAKSELLKQLQKGDQVTVYEVLTVKGAKWAYTSEGWIAMDYLKLDGPLQERDPALGDLATIEFTERVNVRAEPSVNSEKITTLARGSVVHVHETTDALGVKWGRIDEGWVAMKYVKMMDPGVTTVG